MAVLRSTANAKRERAGGAAGGLFRAIARLSAAPGDPPDGTSSSASSRSTTLWWAVVTVLVLLIFSNVLQRRAVLNAMASSSSGGGRPAAVADHPSLLARPAPAVVVVTAPAQPRTPRNGKGHHDQHDDGAISDPEDVTAGPRHLNGNGGDTIVNAEAKKASSWAEGTAAATKDAESVQRALLGFFAAREAARPKPKKACFTALVRHTDEGLRRFVRLLQNVRTELPAMSRRYPFVAFLESHVDLEHIHEAIELLDGHAKGTRVGGEIPLAHVFPAGIILAKLDDSDFGDVPRWVPAQHAWAYGPHNYWGVSYRHMCRFFGVRIMRQDALKRFDYYMRLDTDSFLLAPVRSTVIAASRLMPWDREHRYAVGAGSFMTGATDFIIGGAPADAAPDDDQNSAKIPALRVDPVLPRSRGASAAGASSFLSELGLEEVEVEVDLFHEMAVRGSTYGFLMIHPQTMPQFMHGLFDMYDGFVRKEIEDAHAKPGDPSLPLRDGGRGDRDSLHGTQHGSGPSPFSAPRGLGLHFWDNFEIVDLRVFRSKLDRPIATMKLPPLPSSDATIAERRHHPENLDEPTAPEDGTAINSGDGGDRERGLEFHQRRAQSALRFLDAVDRASGFYTHRWGDAEVRTLTMTLFNAQTEFLYMDALSYQHYHNYHCPVVSNGGVSGTTSGEGERQIDAQRGSHSRVDRQGGPNSNNGGEASSKSEQLSDVVKEIASTLVGNVFLAPSATTTTRELVIEAHEAVDKLVRRLSPGRAQIDLAVHGQCLEEAHKSYGKGSKGQGTAAMHPAEHSPNNRFFWQQPWPQV